MAWFLCSCCTPLILGKILGPGCKGRGYSVVGVELELSEKLFAITAGEGCRSLVELAWYGRRKPERVSRGVWGIEVSAAVPKGRFDGRIGVGGLSKAVPSVLVVIVFGSPDPGDDVEFAQSLERGCCGPATDAGCFGDG